MKKYEELMELERPKSDRMPMPVADRAKIFMPFSALKGYEEALKEKRDKRQADVLEESEIEKKLIDK